MTEPDFAEPAHGLLRARLRAVAMGARCTSG
jgi:hypothetical protein